MNRTPAYIWVPVLLLFIALMVTGYLISH